MWGGERSLICSIVLWHAVSFHWDIRCVLKKCSRKDVTPCHKHIWMVEVMFDEQSIVRSIIFGMFWHAVSLFGECKCLDKINR